MPRTYGEITSTSFPKLFELSHGPSTVFIDAGSGHGLLTKAAVEQFQCAFGLGIEKYREPFEKSTQLNATCSPELQSKLRFVLEDILDTEFEQQLAGITFSTILLVCNNLAFMDGTLTRSARSFRALMDSQRGKTVFIVSTRALTELEDRFFKHLSLEMSWSDAPHEVRIKTISEGAAGGDCPLGDAVGAGLPGAAAGPGRQPTAVAGWPFAAN